MQKNLRWKFIVIAALLVVCLYLFISPRQSGAGLFSRVNLGLDLKGGIHLVLQVKTDDALNQEIAQDAERIASELREKKISFDNAQKGNGLMIVLSGVDSAQDVDVSNHL